MAKKKKKGKRKAQRDTSDISKRNSVLRRKFYIQREVSDKKFVLDDRRYYIPVLSRTPRLTDGRNAEIGIRKDDRKRQTKAKMSFVSPLKTVICLRRKRRRRALFRVRAIGKGKIVSKRRIMTKFSNVRC